MDQDNNSKPVSNIENNPANPTVVSNASPSNQPVATKKNKALLWMGVGIAILLALVIALLLALLTKDDSNNANSNSNSSQSGSTDKNEVKTTLKPAKDIVTAPTTDSDIAVTITGLNKAGSTLTVNYKITYAGSDTSAPKHSISTSQAGIYTTDYKKTVPEPYLIDDATGQKFGLVKDDKGEPLASASVHGYIAKNESVSGYITLTLPPDNSTVALSMGSMPLIPGLTISY